MREDQRFLVCLFGLFVPLENFYTQPLPVNCCKFFTYTWYSWPWSYEDSLARPTPTVTRGICLWVSSTRIRDTRTYCSGAVTTCFYDFGLSELGFEHPTFRLRGERSDPMLHLRSRTRRNFLPINYKPGLIYQLMKDFLVANITFWIW